MYREKARQELHENGTNYTEQIVEATTHETTVVWSLICNTILWVQLPMPALNVILLCTTTFVVPNVIIIIGLILVMVPNVML